MQCGTPTASAFKERLADRTARWPHFDMVASPFGCRSEWRRYRTFRSAKFMPGIRDRLVGFAIAVERSEGFSRDRVGTVCDGRQLILHAEFVGRTRLQ